MTFDYDDRRDRRVAEASPYALNYPSDIDKVPDNAGVYMFFAANDEVIYVGKASGGRLREEIKAKAETPAETGARSFRWFRTNSDELAVELEARWIKKYQPQNNQVGK